MCEGFFSCYFINFTFFRHLEMATSLTKKWSKTVWKEGSQEEEFVIPSSWIEGNYVRWPNSSSAAAALKEMRKPEKNWLKFDLVKVKFSSGMLCTQL